jgi:hypothetical protein
MSSTDTDERRAGLKAALLERLHNPVQLRICVISAVLLVGYGAIYMPLSAQIAEKSRILQRDKKLLDLAGRMERLQKQYRVFEGRLPQQTDSKEWVHYVLEGIRRFPLRLSKLDCCAPKQIGPYKVVVLRIELEGSFFDMDKFLRWLESNHRLFRGDDVYIGPTRENKNILGLQLTVLGLTS